MISGWVVCLGLLLSTADAASPEPSLSLLGQSAAPTEAPADPELTAQIEQLVVDSALLSRVRGAGKLSLVVVDITNPSDLRAAMINPDWETFTASLSKIIVLLGTVTKVDGSARQWRLVRERAEDMIKGSSNEAALSLFGEVGHARIRDAAAAHDLYDAELGGIWWVPRASFPMSPKTGVKICATSRKVARYFVLMEQGRLNNPSDSRRIKDVLHNAKLALLHGGVVRAEPGARYFGKPGVLHDAVSEGMLIEGADVRYIVAVITEGTEYRDPGWKDFGAALHTLMQARHGKVGADE